MSAVPEAIGDQVVEASGRRWAFATAEFDEHSQELRVNGHLVELEPKFLEVLRYLLHHAGEIVTKKELLEAVWPGRFVSDNSLPKAISRIREVLADEDQAVIKTVHGYGYRLIAPVKVRASKATPALTRLDLRAGQHPPLRPNWTLVRPLGSGGQGEVWLVRQDKVNEDRVFKFALDVAGLAAIKREITLYRLLQDALPGHDEFTRVLDWNLEEAPYFIELEFAAGGNLELWAERAGGLADIPLPIRLEVVARIADALAAAHSVGVLHKDLKPSNVLVTDEGDGTPRVKLADFGSGGLLDPQRLEALGITRLGFTRSVLAGEAGATATYLAPEVVAGQPVTVQGDIYSLGIMLYQVVVADLRQPLATGWERRVGDELLCEDISQAVAGEPSRRLSDASALAARLRTLEQRRALREAERAEEQRRIAEQREAVERVRQAERAVERLRTRRQWMLTLVSVLIVGVSVSLALYLDARRARNEAAAAAASSKAVAEFLSNDLFAAVGTKPLRELTVQELLESASLNLERRDGDLPAAAAALHAALGNAFLATESFNASERHFSKALERYAIAEGPGSANTVATAARLFVIVGSRLQAVPDELPRFEAVLETGIQRLGPTHPQVLALREQLATGRFWAGDWLRGSHELEQVVKDYSTARGGAGAGAVAQARLAEMHVQLGDYLRATTLAREALARLGRGSTSSWHDVALVESILARALIEQEQFEEAERALGRAEALVTKWSVGDASMHMLSIEVFRGLSRLRQSQYREAVRILEPAMNRLTALEWFKRNDTLAEFRSWLAGAYQGTRRLAEARTQMQRALAIAETQWGSANPMTQGIRLGLADIARHDDLDAARRILSTVGRDVIDELGGDHPFQAELKRQDGLILAATGNLAEARVALAAALQSFEVRYGANHAFTRRVRRELVEIGPIGP